MGGNRSFAKILRSFDIATVSLVHTITEVTELVWTSPSKALVRGYSVACKLHDNGLGTTQGRAGGCVEVTRASTRLQNAILDRIYMNWESVKNLAGTEIVTCYGGNCAKMERHYTHQEALDYGLLLDFGESIRAISNMTSNITVNTSFTMSLIIEYEDLT